MLPDGGVPLGRAAFEQFAAPDVVDEDVDVVVVAPDPVGETAHLRRVEVVDSDGHAGAAEVGDELGRLLDRLSAVVVRPKASAPAAATGAHDGGTRLTEGGSNAASGPPGRPGDNGHSALQRISVW